LHIAELRLNDAEALEDGEEVLLAMVELFLEVNMIWKRPGNVFVYIREQFGVAFLQHQILH